MESDCWDSFIVSIVVLDQTLRSDIPNFDWFVWTSRCNTCSIRVKTNCVDSLIVILEWTNHILRCHVPKFYSAIFRTWRNKSSVWTELGSLDPVWVGIYTKHKFAVLQLENFEHLVIWSWKQKCSVLWKRNGPDWGRVALDHLGEPFNCVIPDSNSFILGTGYNSVSWWRHCNWVDWTFVTNKPEWSNIWFETPYHHGAVGRATHHLFKIGVETAR